MPTDDIKDSDGDPNLDFCINNCAKLPHGNHLYAIYLAPSDLCDATIPELTRVVEGRSKFLTVKIEKTTRLRCSKNRLFLNHANNSIESIESEVIAQPGSSALIACKPTDTSIIEYQPRREGKKGRLPNEKIIAELDQFADETSVLISEIVLSIHEDLIYFPNIFFFLERKLVGRMQEFRTFNRTKTHLLTYRGPDYFNNYFRTRPLALRIEKYSNASALFSAAIMSDHPFQRLALLVACAKEIVGDGRSKLDRFGSILPDPKLKENWERALETRRHLEHPTSRSVTIREADIASRDLLEIIDFALDRYKV